MNLTCKLLGHRWLKTTERKVKDGFGLIGWIINYKCIRCKVKGEDIRFIPWHRRGIEVKK